MFGLSSEVVVISMVVGRDMLVGVGCRRFRRTGVPLLRGPINAR
jgi:hypothetical protein